MNRVTDNIRLSRTVTTSVFFIAALCGVFFAQSSVHAATVNCDASFYQSRNLPVPAECNAPTTATETNACLGADPGRDSAKGCTILGPALELGDGEAKYVCGKGDGNEVKVAFDFGCIGGDPAKFSGDSLNPIVDIAFALFRFLSAGVGIVVIGSIIVAGIQYATSRGEPQPTSAAIKRIANSVVALLIYIFMFAIANFIVPGGMFI